MTRARRLLPLLLLATAAGFAQNLLADLSLSGSLPDGIVSMPYTGQVTAKGGKKPYVFSVASGLLPPILGLDPDTGAVNGTPTLAGSFNFSIRVTDAEESTDSKSFMVTIAQAPAAAPLRVTTGSLPAGTAGAPYSATLSATGGTTPYTWAVSGLPSGLTADNGGQISGTPAEAGSFPVGLRVTDETGATATGSATLTVAPAPQPLSVTTTSLPNGVVGVAYSASLQAAGGTPPYAWSATGLPAGLQMNAAGHISGTPSTAGNYTIAAQVSDSGGHTATGRFPVSITAALAITTTALPGATTGAAYSASLRASGGTPPYSWSIASGSLPAGLALNSATGAITGTPAANGTSDFTIQVKDALGATARKQFSITIAPALAIMTQPALPAGTAGNPYSQKLSASGGAPPYSFAVTNGSLPQGIALAGAGDLGGTPQQAGSFSFTVQVTDAASATASLPFTLSIGLGGMPAVAITDLPDSASPLQQPQFNVKLNQAYSVPLSGQLSLSFAPDAAVPIDDPAIQFSSGGRTLGFTIAAGATQATFPSAAVLQTGSVAGTITVTATIQAAGVDATPSPAPSHSIRIARTAPVIRAVRLVKTSNGFEAWITGYSPSRELTKANFTFNAASGSDLQTTQLELSLADSSKQWYQDSASNLFGSQFTIVQPFTVQGDTSAVTSVSVTLSNAQGASAPGTASF